MKWKPIKVLFVGDKPSNKNVRSDIPFVGTPSYSRLLSWIAKLDLDIRNIDMINVDKVDKTDFSRYNKIISLGKNSDFYNQLGWYKYKNIDHPSPRNRKFNDPNYEKKMLKSLKEWLYEQS
jgi:uracil-DNA glycosylase